MRVLYFMNHVDKGGAYLALYDFLKEILERYDEIEPIVITGKKNDFNRKLDELGIENYYAPFKNFISSYKKPIILYKLLLWIRYHLFKPIAIYKIKRKINFKKIDLIHSNLDRIDIGAYFSKKYNIPHIWHLREHLDDDFEVVSIYNDYIKHMNKYPSKYIAISKSVRQKWEKRGIKKENIELIYDGIKQEKLYKLIPKKQEILNIIFLGGYYKNKGQEFLIDIIYELFSEGIKNINVDFYGNGDKKYIQYLNEKIEKNSLTDIIHINPYMDDIYSRINKYNVGINCSKCEGFGRVTVEYMAAGLCTIASNTGANVELIENEKNGFLYEYGNKESIKNIIRKLNQNLNMVYIYGKEAKKKAKENYSIETHAQNIVAMYKRVLE